MENRRCCLRHTYLAVKTQDGKSFGGNQNWAAGCMMRRYGCGVVALSLIHSSERAAVLGLYHDATEIITGDMPTPIKYYNPEIRQDVYKRQYRYRLSDESVLHRGSHRRVLKRRPHPQWYIAVHIRAFRRALPSDSAIRPQTPGCGHCPEA